MSNIVKVVAQGAAVVPDNAITEDEIAPSSISDEHVSATADIDPTKIDGTAVVESRQVNTGTGLTGGGDLTADRTLAVDFTAVATAAQGVKADAAAPAATIGNLLTANQASLETDTTGWSGASVVIERDTSQYVSGVASMKVTSSTSTSTTKAAYTSAQVTGVVAGQTYTVMAKIKSDGTALGKVGVVFWSSSAALTTPQYGNSVTAATWQDSIVTVTAPDTADRAFVYIYLDSAAAAGTYINADHISLHQGVGGVWALPGTPVSGVLPGGIGTAHLADRSVTAAKIDPAVLSVNQLNTSQAIFTVTPSPGFGYYLCSGAVVDGAGSDGVGNVLRVTSTGSGAAFYPPLATATAGTTYTATVRVKASTQMRMRLQFRTAGGADLTHHDALSTGSGAWETLTLTATAPATAGQFYLFIYTGAASGTIDIERFGWWVGVGGALAPDGQAVNGLGARVTASGVIEVWNGMAWITAASLDPIAPRVILPADVSAVVGDTLQVFRRGVIEAADPYSAPSKMDCAKGAEFARFWEWTPAAGDAGTSQTLTVTAQGLDQSTLAAGSTSIVVSTATNPASMKRVMCVGDSLTSGGVWPAETYRRLTQAGGTPAGHGFTNYNFIGGTPLPGYGSQGYFGAGGWTWATYTGASPLTAYVLTAAGHGKDDSDQKSVWTAASSTWYIEDVVDADTLKVIRLAGTDTLGSSGTLTWSSGGVHTAPINWTNSVAAASTPFWDGSAFSIKAWCDTYNGGDGPDLVVALLGWNNITASAVASGYTAVVNQAKVFADKLHTEYPDAKMCVLGLQMPSPDGGLGTNYGATGVYSHYYDLVRYTNGLNLAYRAWAAEAGYSSWLRYASLAAQFDSENNMPAGTAAVNSRNAATERRGTNGVHPANAGYLQIADVAYREIVRAFA